MRPESESLQQLFNHRAMIDRRDGATRMIIEADVRVDPQHLEDGVVQVTRAQRAVCGELAETIRGSDSQTATESTTRDQDRQHIPPVVASGSALTERWATIASVARLPGARGRPAGTRIDGLAYCVGALASVGDRASLTLGELQFAGWVAADAR